MPVIGITGNFASGKSHVAEIFRGQGAMVQDSDKVAHNVMDEEAFAEVAAAFPEAVVDGKIDRKILGRLVFADNEKLEKLETIMHPKVRARNRDFIELHKDKPVVLEIPLLFETRAQQICDHVIFVNVKPEVQKKRALARPGMTEEKLKQVLARQNQIPTKEKMRNSDFIIENSGEDVTVQVKNILEKLGISR